jgi:hypothetical protein
VGQQEQRHSDRADNRETTVAVSLRINQLPNFELIKAITGFLSVEGGS